MTDARPPESIEVGLLLLRRWCAADAAALTDAISTSLDHLRPWMPWAAAEPVSVAERRGLLARWDQGWEDRTELNYGLFLHGRVIGSAGLMARIGPGGWEIGYWVHVDHVGRGHATAAARALTDVAFGLPGTTHVEIHHDTANVASGRVPAKLGYRLVGDETDQVMAPAEVGVKRIWRTSRQAWTARHTP
jgi:ribosomal-protein-serine acetyltransferase